MSLYRLIFPGRFLCPKTYIPKIEILSNLNWMELTVEGICLCLFAKFLAWVEVAVLWITWVKAWVPEVCRADCSMLKYVSLQYLKMKTNSIFWTEKKIKKNEMRKILRDANCITKAHKISSIQMPWDLGYLVISMVGNHWVVSWMRDVDLHWRH